MRYRGRMLVGDLFSGIGGFSLAAEWMGWETAFFSEIDPYASAVLKTHWPDVPNLGDITRIDWSTAPRVDVLTGGFPCQPHSLAGKRAASADPRDLWSECVRSLRSLRPDFAVFENVTGLFTSDGGRFFNRVLSDLAALRYDAEWRVLSAADVGAAHRRERVWITANAQRPGRKRLVAHDRISRRAGAAQSLTLHRAIAPRNPLDAHLGVLRNRDGFSVAMERRRLHGLGNSIVPQCAYEIFRALAARNQCTPNRHAPCQG
jgi:DNA-cytosine methyltransferase